MARRTFGMIAAVILILGLIAGIKYSSVRKLIQARAAMKPPPVTVSAVQAAESPWQRRYHAVGNLAAAQGVTMSNELAGTVANIVFESGQHVKEGDLLVQLDISTDEAQLRGLEAQAALAKITLQRARELRAANSNAQADLDGAAAQYQEALASVDNQQAIIAKKTLRAPFSGLLGIRQVNRGQYLAAGTAIVALQALDPIYVNFSLPEQDFTHLKVGQTVHVTVEAYPGETFAGAINALDSKVDDATHNLEVQATVRNLEERLVPGMFASIDVVLPQQDQFITLPGTAIVYNPYGNAVYVIEKGRDAAGGETLIARQRFVQLGETRGDQVAIVKGVQAGEQVVTAGQLKLRNGAAVQINNTVAPATNPAPAPPNT
ncbi:MAG: efflux RND transporter periplasmic adaptor subunit [Opitutaceae bacterium]